MQRSLLVCVGILLLAPATLSCDHRWRGRQWRRDRSGQPSENPIRVLVMTETPRPTPSAAPGTNGGTSANLVEDDDEEQMMLTRRRRDNRDKSENGRPIAHESAGAVKFRFAADSSNKSGSATSFKAITLENNVKTGTTLERGKGASGRKEAEVAKHHVEATKAGTVYGVGASGGHDSKSQAVTREESGTAIKTGSSKTEEKKAGVGVESKSNNKDAKVTKSVNSETKKMIERTKTFDGNVGKGAGATKIKHKEGTISGDGAAGGHGSKSGAVKTGPSEKHGTAIGSNINNKHSKATKSVKYHQDHSIGHSKTFDGNVGKGAGATKIKHKEGTISGDGAGGAHGSKSGAVKTGTSGNYGTAMGSNNNNKHSKATKGVKNHLKHSADHSKKFDGNVGKGAGATKHFGVTKAETISTSHASGAAKAGSDQKVHEHAVVSVTTGIHAEGKRSWRKGVDALTRRDDSKSHAGKVKGSITVRVGGRTSAGGEKYIRANKRVSVDARTDSLANAKTKVGKKDNAEGKSRTV